MEETNKESNRTVRTIAVVGAGISPFSCRAALPFPGDIVTHGYCRTDLPPTGPLAWKYVKPEGDDLGFCQIIQTPSRRGRAYLRNPDMSRKKRYT